MFAEPQTLTVNAVAKNLPRVSMLDRAGTFESTADGLTFRITHNLGKRNRRTVRLDITKTAADPLLDGVSRPYSMSVQFIIDHPQVGFDSNEVLNNVQALVDWLDVAGNLTKVVGGES